MKKGSIIRAIISILALVAAVSCSSIKKSDTEHPLISSYTSGNVSVATPIIVRFTDDVVFKETPEPGGKVDKKFFDISPKIEGKAVWLDDRTIEFHHPKPLQNDKSYLVKLNLSRIIETGNMPGNFKFEIFTTKTTFTNYIQGLSLYSEYLPDQYFLNGSISTSDYVEAAVAEKILNVEPGKLEISWTHNSSGTFHEFRIDSIFSGNNPYDIILEFDGKHIGQAKKTAEIINIPEKGVFKLLDVSVDYSPEFKITASFSAPLEEKQRMGNYISLSDGSDMRFVVSLNKVYIYPPSRKTGPFTLNFNKGIRSRDGNTLEEDIFKDIFFDDIEPAVRFISKGAILPSENNMSLPFRAVNYADVEVSVTRIYENNILQFLQVNRLDEGSNVHRVGKEIERKTIPLGDPESESLRNWNTYTLDLSKLIQPEPGAIYRVKIRGKNALVSDSDEGYYSDYYFGSYSTYRDRIRNIFVSDLGIIAKSDDNDNYNVYVTNLISANPESGVTVRAYDYQNQLLKEVITDNSGMAVLELKEHAWLIVATKGKQTGYLSVNYGNSLNMSSFDISGERINKGLKGFIYGERGVWRPGNSIHLSFILHDKNNILPDNHPVNLDFVNPLGQTVASQVKTRGENGLYTFGLATDQDAPTGNWSAEVRVGGDVFYKTLKIETVKPNRLKIDFKVNDEPSLVWDKISGKLHSAWLHGAKAPELAVKIDLKLSTASTAFKGFEDYIFTDRTKQFETEEFNIVDKKTDQEGSLTFSEKVEGLSEAPGILRADFTARVYEPGGDFSIDQYSTYLAPYKKFVGIQTPKGAGYYNRIETNKTQIFKIVTVSDSGKPTGNGEVEVEVYKMDWNWWWNSTDEGLASYAQNSYRTPITTSKVRISDGKGEFRYKWEYNDWGQYLIRVKDPDGGHSAVTICYVDWGEYDRNIGGESTGATMLTFSADKEKYFVGETVKITIPSSKGTRALLTVETVSKILSSSWVDCSDEQTVIEIPANENMAPNAYAHITLIQPYNQTVNDAPMRLYGVIPIFVEDPATRLAPVISIPAEIRPETEFKVKVSEKNGKPMSYTIAIVDDGLLDLTRFKTPDPWSSMYMREALGIMTWDLYDLVLGAYGGKIEQLFAIGGDDELNHNANYKAQRFKPVVKFLGPFNLKKGGSNEHSVTLPPYIGSVRTMVVATSGDAFGAADFTSVVKKPLMISTSLPRVIGTEEEFLVPVTVFAMDESIKNVKVGLTQSDNFTVSGQKSQNISFTETEDNLVYFKLKAPESEAIGKVTVKVSSGREIAEETIEIDIRNPNPRITVSSIEIVDKGKTFNGNMSLAGIKGTNTATIEVSSLPPLNLSTRLRYLLNYPHGCIEQTTSAAFPQLYLSSVAATDNETNARSEANVKAALNRLTKFQVPEGGFSYWPGERYANEWGTTYAGHFMIEAERIGYALPSGMKSRWLDYIKSEARNWSASRSDYTDQAYRLYVLSLANSSERGAMNRLLEERDLDIASRWLLAGAFAYDGRNDIARNIINNMPDRKDEYSPFNSTFGSPERDMAVNLTVLTAIGDRRNAFDIVKGLSDILGTDKWLSTQSTAWSLMAISQYIEKTRENSQMEFEYNAAGKKETISTVKAVSEIELDVKNNVGTIPVIVANKGDNTLYVKMTSSGTAAKGAETAASNGLKITVEYTGADGKTLDVKTLPQETDFYATVSVTNPGGRGRYTNMVLSHIFPSGWEIRNDRLNFEQEEDTSVRYQDIRDDRVYSYFDLRSNETIKVRVSLTATYSGKFYLPAVICEAMYDNTINATTSGFWCEVTEQ
ncbi:MAG: MG2 domain-containing protein [Rikenellaceae bacterium]|nr:MG2 domain-containing protein [Rikenellaceae bacterium]